MNIAIRGKRDWQLLTNEGLQVGDRVWPLVGWHLQSGLFCFTGLVDVTNDDPAKVLASTGWPSEPHTVLDFYQEGGLRWIHTDKGYSPADAYFRLVS